MQGQALPYQVTICCKLRNYCPSTTGEACYTSLWNGLLALVSAYL